MNSNNGPRISRTGSGLPPRIIFHGVEGIGKTSWAACSHSPIFGMTAGETGLLTLIDAHRIQPADHFDEFKSWSDLLNAILYLIKTPLPNRTFVLDTLNGAQAMCFQHVCTTRFRGRPDLFAAFGKGPEVSQTEWAGFLALLDQLREKRDMAMIALCHTKVKSYHNPLGDDYDRFTPDMHDKIWGLSHKWSDMVLFGNFDVAARKDSVLGRAKGSGGNRRTLLTERSAAWDAKNRYGLPRQIPLGNTAQEGWTNFAEAMQAVGTPSAAVPEKVATPTPTPQANGAPPAPPATAPTTPTSEQLQRLAELRQELFERTAPDATPIELTAMWRDQVLAKRGVTTARALTPQQASELIQILEHHLATLDLSDDLYAEEAPTGTTGGH